MIRWPQSNAADNIVPSFLLVALRIPQSVIFVFLSGSFTYFCVQQHSFLSCSRLSPLSLDPSLTLTLFPFLQQASPYSSWFPSYFCVTPTFCLDFFKFQQTSPCWEEVFSYIGVTPTSVLSFSTPPLVGRRCSVCPCFSKPPRRCSLLLLECDTNVLSFLSANLPLLDYQELILNTLATLNNISYYAQTESYIIQRQKEVAECELEGGEISLGSVEQAFWEVFGIFS